MATLAKCLGYLLFFALLIAAYIGYDTDRVWIWLPCGMLLVVLNAIWLLFVDDSELREAKPDPTKKDPANPPSSTD